MPESYKVLQEFNGKDTPIDGGEEPSCRLKKVQKILMGLAIAALVLIIIGLIIGLAIRFDVATPSNSLCPSSPPNSYIKCSHVLELSAESCTAGDCCWQGNASLCYYETQCLIDPNDRFTCIPDEDNWNDTKARSMCAARGCCWNSNARSPVKCFYPRNYGYVMTNQLATPTGITASFSRKKPFPSMFGGDAKELKIEVTYETSQRLRVKLYDSSSTRYEVPLNLTSSSPPVTSKPSTMLYSVKLLEDPFGIEIIRSNPSKTIFKTAPGLVFSDQFLQISSYLSSQYVYGLGEHATPWRLNMNYSRLTLFARDVPPDPVYDTTRNLYGVHPFYLSMEEDGNTHGVFFLNSNAIEIELLPYPAITYRTIGGILDFYYFLGPTPDAVISQYTELIGRPYFPPYWSLGFHLCRWGYFSSNRTLEIVQRMRDHNIPQDTQWNDIDYMSRHLDFTYNHTSYSTMPQLVDNLHAHGQHYVVITDPGIKADLPPGSYAPYDDGVNEGIFILNSSGQPLLGQVWPGITAYPDFTNPSTEDYWLKQIAKFHDNISFDGLWIDMNEPSNFIPGSVDGCDQSSTLNNPPYLPVAIRSQGNILDKTVCMTGRQYLSSHYNAHSLYGHTEAIQTMDALTKLLNKRSLVISRSTYPGSGTHCGHWLGDNASQWPHLRQSIPGILNFALFGIPLVGADICGFFGDTTKELCTRWQQLGAFYPFSRNHNTYNAIPQDPTEFDEESINSTRAVLLTRYKLLPFLYTLFYYAHTEGRMVARPLLSVFPSDRNTWTNGNQFMWGRALLISPVLDEGARNVTAYFPAGQWFNYYNGSGYNSNGQYMVLDAPLTYIPLHVLGGNVIPQQRPNTTTISSRVNPYSLLVALDHSGLANGSLFTDDGEELNSITDGHYTLVTFDVKPNMLISNVVHAGYINNTALENIMIYGLSQPPASVSLNDSQITTWSWNDMVLDVYVDVVSITESFTLSWT